MIFIVKEKKIVKHMKKWCKPKDYIIYDTTDDDTAPLAELNHVVALDQLNPPGRCVRAKIEKDSFYNSGKFKKVEKKHFEGKQVEMALTAIIVDFASNHDGDVNVFIVLQKDAYKAYAKAYKKLIKQLSKADFKFVYTEDDLKDDDGILKKSLNAKKTKVLKKNINKFAQKFKK